MLRGGVIVVTALFTIFFLKKRLYKHNFIGCTMAVIGITIVGVSSILFNNSHSSESSVKKYYLFLNINI